MYTTKRLASSSRLFWLDKNHYTGYGGVMMYYRDMYFKSNPGRRIRGKKGPQYRCETCKKWFSKDKITVDHIIPVRKGGIDCLGNLRPLCRPCNSRKGTKVTKLEFLRVFFSTALEYKLHRLISSMLYRRFLDFLHVPYRRDI